MKSKIVDVAYSVEGYPRVTLEFTEEVRALLDPLKDKLLDVDIKEYRPKRSLGANGLLWQMCKKIADATGGISKEDVYRRNIREVGEYYPIPIKDECVAQFQAHWRHNGSGWFVDVTDRSKIKGYTLVFAYYGSSTYDTEQMRRLLDNVMQDARAVGVETMSELELISLLESERGERP